MAANPIPKTIAYANEGLNWSDKANITGTKIAAEPVLEEISVKNTIIAIDVIRITHKGAALIALKIDEAIHSVVPVVAKIDDKQRPPPKIIKIPQPIFFSRSFQLSNPKAGAKAVIKIAIM